MVNRTNKTLAALMREAVVRDLDGDTLVLTVKSPALSQMVSSKAAVITAALYEEWGQRWQIRCEVAGERGGTSSAASRPVPSMPAPARTDSRPPADRSAPAAPAAGQAGGNGGDTGWPEP
ncbi:DNA polymerase III subunit gamma and tau, partial [Micromonospora sonneratiae]